MGKYVLLLNWTDQGIRNVKDTVKRAESLKSYLEKKNGKLVDILYTFGQYDAIVTAELPNDEIAIIIDDPSQLPPVATSMSKTPELKRQDLTAVRLAHPVEGCQPLAIPEKGAMLKEGDRIFQATGEQDGMLSNWSGREPVTQIGTIRRVFPAGRDGPLAYFSDLSGGEGGSGGGIFRVVSGQLSLEAIVQGAGTPDLDGKPYNEEIHHNQTGLVGLDGNVLHPMLALLPQPRPSP